MKTTLSSRAKQIVRKADDAKSRDLLFVCTIRTAAEGEEGGSAREKQVPPRAP
jgi:hypothetical protein